MHYTKEQLEVEIAKRAPWYQSIDFPEYGISTTDKPENMLDDDAWDNKIGDLSIQEATRLRPKPKWNAIRDKLPNVTGMDVLEIGCNCGFFSFGFARDGAKSVTGLDVASKWLSNANWCKEVLGYSNIRFYNCDFMLFDGSDSAGHGGLLSNKNQSVPLPDNLFDLIFSSTVLDHLFFPLFAIYKMIRMSRRWVVIDVPLIEPRFKDESLLKFSYSEDLNHHGFNGSKSLFLGYFQRLGVPESDIRCHEYNDYMNITYVIDTSNFSSGLVGV